MGFGMNKWVYKQRPRKFFSKERKPVADTLTKQEHSNIYTNDHPQLTGRLNEKKSAEELKEARFEQKVRKIYRIIIYAAVLVCAIFIFVNYQKNKESKQAARQARFEMIKEREKREKAKFHQITYEYGMNHIKKQDYKRAVKEFGNLINAMPNDPKVQKAYAKALYLQCLNDSIQCHKAALYYERIFNENKLDLDRKRLAEIYIHLAMFEKADSVLSIKW